MSFDEEERVESHLDGCAECRTALERQKALHEAVDGAAVTPSPALLSRCREDLAELLGREKPAVGMESLWWRQIDRQLEYPVPAADGGDGAAGGRLLRGEGDARLEFPGRR